MQTNRYLKNINQWKFIKPTIDHTTYIDIFKDILQKNEWCRNLILITPRGTGKSQSVRSAIRDICNVNSSNDLEKIDIVRQSTMNYIAHIIESNNSFKIAWIRDTETAIKQQVVGRFEQLFHNNKNYKVLKDGVYFKNEPLPRIAFIGLNTPWNYLDSGLQARLVVYDEIISYSVSANGEMKQNTIPNFVKTFSDVYQGITRPYYRDGNDDDIPLLICLGNPRAATTDLYNLFQINFNWDSTNRKDIVGYNKQYRLIYLWLTKFEINEMKMSLGSELNLGQEYPKMREVDKNIVFFYEIEKIFKAQYGICWNKRYYAIDLLMYSPNDKIKPFQIVYFYELENARDTSYKKDKDIIFYCIKHEDKERANVYNEDLFKSFVDFGKNSRILVSSAFAENQILKHSDSLIPFCIKKFQNK